MGKLIQFAINRPVTVAMIFLGMVLFGMISLRELSVDLLPNVQFPRLSVQTIYSGAAPEEVENFITTPLESYLNTVPGVKNIHSVSREGLSLITMEFAWGTRMDFALVHTREKLDNARYFLPQGAGRPTVIQYDPASKPIMLLALTGPEDLIELNSFAKEMLKPRLEQIHGVASAEISGGVEREIQIDLNQELLALYGISVQEVTQRIDAFNKGFQGGRIKKGRFEYSLRVAGEFASINEIEEVPLRNTAEKGAVKLKDIAIIKDSIKEREGFTRLNEKECLGISIYKEAGANTVKVTKEVRKILEQIKRENPNIRIQVISEESRYIENSISSLKNSMTMGAVLVFLVLILFLQNFKDSINIAIAIPIAVISTFNLLYFRDITLNIMSLGGLALGMGMFVENSIVVVESIYRARASSGNMKEAAYLGTKEVAMPIVASILTTIAVFLPVIYVHGVAGQLFKDQSLTVTFSLLASLFVALLLLPMLAGREWKVDKAIGKGRETMDKEQGTKIFLPFKWISALFGFIGKILSWLLTFIISSILIFLRYLFSLVSRLLKPFLNFIFKGFNSGYGKFYSVYHEFLIWSLDNKMKVIVGTFLIIAVTAGVFLILKKELMPKPRTSSFEIQIQTPIHYSIEETLEVVSQLEKWIMEEKRLEYLYSQTGLVGGTLASRTEFSLNSATFIGKLKNWKDVPAFMDKIRDKMKTLPVIASIKEEETALSKVLVFGAEGIRLKVFGEDLERLKQISGDLVEKIKPIKGVKDLRTNIREGKPELLVRMRIPVLEKYGISSSEVGAYLINAVRGMETSSPYTEFDKKIGILVRFEEMKRVEYLLSQQGYFNGRLIPLRELISMEEVKGPSEIRRENQRRVVVIEGNLAGRKISEVAPDIEKIARRHPIPENYRIELGGEEEEVKESFRSLRFAFLLASLLVFMILASHFESFLHPFIIILTIPMGLIGGVWALFLTSQSINVISLIGTIVVTGIVVNDAIVKVDYMNYCRKMGMGIREAILKTSETKVRPVIMNTITDVFGVLPTAIAIGEGTELQQPLAIAFIGGLTVATILTIILIPVIYEMLERGKERTKDGKF